MIYTMYELQNKVVKSTIATAYKKCYECLNFGKIDNLSPIHVIINFMDRTSVQLCSTHYSKFKQRRN